MEATGCRQVFRAGTYTTVNLVLGNYDILGKQCSIFAKSDLSSHPSRPPTPNPTDPWDHSCRTLNTKDSRASLVPSALKVEGLDQSNGVPLSEYGAALAAIAFGARGNAGPA